MMGNDAYDRLVAHGIKPSVQRMAIMHYLLTHKTHPTVEEVYGALCEDMPTLSRTTVYNTLHLLSESNVVQIVTIDEHRVCYDGDISPHIHFYCKRCKRIIDLRDGEAPLPMEYMNGNRVDSVQLYCKGICADCLKKECH